MKIKPHLTTSLVIILLLSCTAATNTRPIAPVTDKCLKLGDEKLPSSDTDNLWILLTEFQPPYPSYLLNLATGAKTPITDKLVYPPISVSPNMQELAYSTYSGTNAATAKIIIKNYKGEITRIVPWEHAWRGFLGWQGTDSLIIQGSQSKREQLLPPLILLDLSSNTRQEVNFLDFPDFDYNSYRPDLQERIFFGPDRTRAVYPSIAEETSSISLFDMSNQKVLTVLPVSRYETAPPEWSYDGNDVIVVGTVAQRRHSDGNIENYDQEIFLINEIGETNRITHLADQYESLHIGMVSWSSDKLMVAFWFRADESNHEQLAILNLTTGLITNYCVTRMINSGGSKPIWSPESKIVFANIIETEIGRPWQVIWINVTTDEGAILRRNTTTEGLLVSQEE